MFGTRMPPGYQTYDFLGRGTVSIVWLVKSQRDGRSYAAKQFPIING